jgi:tetratricopeptide (TPR) repeat protein
MKLFPILYLLFFGHVAFGQDQNLLQRKKYFDTELKQWTKSFSDFSLSDFKLADTLHFDNNYAQDLKSLKEFLSVYKPVITYSVDSSKFIDIYSYQLNLEKKGNYYEANTDIDQAILLCNPKAKYWNRIFFGTSSQWIDEVVWLSKTQFILVGITKSEDDKRRPIILLGETNKQSLLKYVDTNKQTFQNDKGYSSLKLKRIKIKGL